MTVYEQGRVVVATDPFGRGRHRPWIVVSNATHPFDDEECLAAAVTTTTRERAVALSGAFVEGGLPQVSYASPWAVMTLKHDSITHTTGRVSKGILVELARGIEGYVTPGSDTDSAGDE